MDQHVSLELLGVPDTVRVHSHSQILCHGPSPGAHGKDGCNKHPRVVQGCRWWSAAPPVQALHPAHFPRPLSGETMTLSCWSREEMLLRPEPLHQYRAEVCCCWGRGRNVSPNQDSTQINAAEFDFHGGWGGAGDVLIDHCLWDTQTPPKPEARPSPSWAPICYWGGVRIVENWPHRCHWKLSVEQGPRPPSSPIPTLSPR